MDIIRNAKCENCFNADICKYKSAFIDGTGKIKSIATSMGRGTNITIECKYYSSVEVEPIDKFIKEMAVDKKAKEYEEIREYLINKIKEND